MTHPGTSAGGHITGMPTRSLRASSAIDAGLYLPVGRARLALTRFAPPGPAGPFRRPPPAVRRRDGGRTDGDARRASQ